MRRTTKEDREEIQNSGQLGIAIIVDLEDAEAENRTLRNVAVIETERREKSEAEAARLREVLLKIEGVHHECNYRVRDTDNCASCTVANLADKGLRP